MNPNSIDFVEHTTSTERNWQYKMVTRAVYDPNGWCSILFYSSITFRGSVEMKCNDYKELSSGTKNSELGTRRVTEGSEN